MGVSVSDGVDGYVVDAETLGTTAWRPFCSDGRACSAYVPEHHVHAAPCACAQAPDGSLCKVDGLRRECFLTLPNTLVFQFKRFELDLQVTPGVTRIRRLGERPSGDVVSLCVCRYARTDPGVSRCTVVLCLIV